MEKQLLDRIKKLEKNVVNLYHIQGTEGNTSGSNITTTLLGETIYSVIPGTPVPAETAYSSIFLGFEAGAVATNAYNSIFLGLSAGKNATEANNSNFLGKGAGQSAFLAQNSNFFGLEAGFTATNAYNSNFFGEMAGKGAGQAFNCNFFGREAGRASSGNNVNAFGFEAGIGNALSGQTIFSNSSLPSFLNRAAAVLAISTATGGINENTYLYYNQTTFAIEAIRLED